MLGVVGIGITPVLIIDGPSVDGMFSWWGIGSSRGTSRETEDAAGVTPSPVVAPPFPSDPPMAVDGQPVKAAAVEQSVLNLQPVPKSSQAVHQDSQGLIFPAAAIMVL